VRPPRPESQKPAKKQGSNTCKLEKHDHDAAQKLVEEGEGEVAMNRLP